MLYREAGQFKSSYAADQAIFPIAQDRVFVLALLFAAIVVPFALPGTYWFNAVLIPFMIFSMAALGLNILVGYCGQISLGTGGFMAVGIPLKHIWAIVWTVAGFVALVAGLLWGSRNGVQYALTFIALKALPVLILGGFESVPGAIVGGLIIGATEKLAEVYLGPYFAGGGIENWFPYVFALVFLLFRPQGLFGEKIIERV